jgi:5-methyltetrahydrofolate--homocysteine methyltransferase
MRKFADRIAAGETLVCDGATGTMLFEMGLEPGACPEAIALTRRELLDDIATQYLQAGADIVETCTFGASPLKLAQYNLDARTEEINRAAVEAVRRVVGGRAYVGASVGPSGKILQPYGDVSETQVYGSYRRQLEALVAAGIDCVLIETMLDINEARLAIRAAKDVSADIPVTATMTFDATPRGFFTIMGTDVAGAVSGLVDAGADVVGSNCGNGIEKMVEIARVFRDATDHPLIIQSNAGLPETVGGKVVYRETPEFMSERVEQLLELGVAIIGGCCGTTPDHIKAFRALVDGAARKAPRSSATRN